MKSSLNQRRKQLYDKSAKSLPPLSVGQKVRIFNTKTREWDTVGEVVSRDDLYAQVRGIAYDGLDRGMDIHVSRLRRKLRTAGLDADAIKSIRGAGYLLARR